MAGVPDTQPLTPSPEDAMEIAEEPEIKEEIKQESDYGTNELYYYY